MHGRYCHICGQENVEPKETFWHLVTHFVYDVTHFDGKFFSTVKFLLFRPGFLSEEYIRGRRTSYLNPIRMYVFTSAFFFLFFFSVVKPDDDIIKGGTKTTKQIKTTLLADRLSLQEQLKIPLDDSTRRFVEKELALVNEDLSKIDSDTLHIEYLNAYKNDLNSSPLGKSKYHSVEEYDSVQHSLPASKRDGWLSRELKKKKIHLQEKYGADQNAMLAAISQKFMHSFPQLLFVSLPIFALLLQLLYVRRKQFYYADHIIYTIHLYCAMFILIFIRILAGKAMDLPYMHWLSFFRAVVVIYIIWYLYKSLRNFYQQHRGKTILKFLLLLFMSMFVMVFLFIVFGLLSVIRA